MIPALLIGVLASTHPDAPHDSGLVACAYPDPARSDQSFIDRTGRGATHLLVARKRARKAASASTLPRDRILAHRDEDRR